MQISFNGLRALVTGSSRGIGEHIATTLAQYGAEVYGADQMDGPQKKECRIKHIKIDLTDWCATEKAIECYGPFDLLVNCAGIAILGPLTNIEEEHVDKVLAVNIKAMINVTRIVVKGLIKANKPGSIINISSQASLIGLLDHSTYCASKGAVDAFTRAAALEYGPNNIRVNAVNPTVIMTDMGKANWSDPKIAKPMLEKIPLRRFGEVAEVTYPVIFLLSDKASLITGVCLPLDGGYTAA